MRDASESPTQYVVYIAGNNRWYYWDGERFHRDHKGGKRVGPPDSDVKLLEDMLRRNGEL